MPCLLIHSLITLRSWWILQRLPVCAFPAPLQACRELSAISYDPIYHFRKVRFSVNMSKSHSCGLIILDLAKQRVTLNNWTFEADE